MAGFFWQYCEGGNCVRQWLFFSTDILVFFFTLYSTINTYRLYGKLRFDLVPLAVNSIATLTMTFLQLFEEGYEFYLATFLIQIYTYFLFCYTFVMVYTRATRTNSQLDALIKKTSHIIFGVFTLLIVILVVVVFSNVLSATCDQTYQIAFIMFFVLESVLYGVTMFYGVKIVRNIKAEQRNSLTTIKTPTESFEDSTFMGDRYYRDRLRQIMIILFSYSLTILLRIVWFILNGVYRDSHITCTLIDQATIINSNSFLGNLILSINSIIDLIPHILLPIAMYVIPAPRLPINSQAVEFQSGYVDADQVLVDSKDDQVRKKLSMLMESTYSH